MVKRSRKRSVVSSRKKSKNQPIPANDEESDINSTTEAWILMEFISFEDLSKDDAAVYDTNNCQLKALYVYKGEVTKDEWKSCIDCQLRDYEVWPTKEECEDATDSIPFTKEMILIAKSKCTNQKNIIFPLYISSTDSDQELENENTMNESDSSAGNDEAVMNILQVPPVLTVNDIETRNLTSESENENNNELNGGDHNSSKYCYNITLSTSPFLS